MRPLPSTSTVPRLGTSAVLNIVEGATVVGDELAEDVLVEADDDADFEPDEPQAARTTGAATAKATAPGQRRLRCGE